MNLKQTSIGGGNQPSVSDFDCVADAGIQIDVIGVVGEEENGNGVVFSVGEYCVNFRFSVR